MKPVRTTRLAALAFLIMSGMSSVSFAQTSLSKNMQVPGVYKMQLGETKITALFDGVVYLKRNELKGLDSAAIDQSLHNRYVPENDNGLQTAVNAYLVDTGDAQILIDTGTADCFPGDLGHVISNLRYAGYAPEDIDEILLTHGHPDHLCGILDKDKRIVYPNANIWIEQSELQYWMSDEAKKRAPKKFGFIFDLANTALKPYQDSNRVKTFNASTSLPAGITLLPTPGHTVGHSSFVVTSDRTNDALLVWGDVVHYHAVQLQRPEATYEPDVNYAQSVKSRQMVLHQAEQNHWWVAGAHMPFPGIGHLRKQAQGYAWVPAEFSPLTLSRENTD